MLEPQQIIDSLESISRNVMLTEEQRLAASAAAFGDHQGNPIDSELACVCADEITSSAIKLKIAIEALEKIASKKTYTRPVEAWYKDGNQLCLSCCQLIEDHDESCQLHIAAQALKQIAGDDNEIPNN